MRHDLLHKLPCIIKDSFVVDQYFADVIAQMITKCPYEQIAFLVNQERGRALGGGLFDGCPQLQQIIEIPLQFIRVASNTGGTYDDAYIVG